MGYYTKYELTVYHEKDLVMPLQGTFNLPEAGRTAITGACTLLFLGEATKWYEHEEDMRAFSNKVGNTNKVFVLDGTGERSGDIWRKVFYRGNFMGWEQPEVKRPGVYAGPFKQFIEEMRQALPKKKAAKPTPRKKKVVSK